jgi:YggT family protein
MIIHLFLQLLSALKWVIIIDAVLSWVMPSKESFPRSFTSQISDPMCAPFRPLVGPERLGGMDLSPLAVILLLEVMSTLIRRAAL